MGEAEYPRDLASWERELLLWVLPEDRPGYREYRELVEEWKVVAQGRRGRGNYILAPQAQRADNESPLPQVLAYGIVETDAGSLSVTVRERLEDQVEFELAVLGTGELTAPSDYRRRWTLSNWLPGQSCPICGSALREVSMGTATQRLSLAICRDDRRLWVYDSATGVNHPVPLTNFYNELMIWKHVRDPNVAFSSHRLFERLEEFTDSDLAGAFSTYNMIRTKVPVEGSLILPPHQRKSVFQRIKSAFKRSSH